MKKSSHLVILLLILGVGIFLTAKSTSALSTSNKLNGKILLQVESKGEAWYVYPIDGKRYSMGRPDDALNLMRTLGLGISNDNLEKIKIADENLTGQDSDSDGLSDMIEDSVGTDKNKKDSDNDGFDDKNETINGYNPKGAGKALINNNFAEQQSGKILLQVGNKGEAWYVNPNDNKRYFLGRPNDAFNLMRKLGLGITNNDLNKILENGQTYTKTTDYGPFYDVWDQSISKNNWGFRYHIVAADNKASAYAMINNKKFGPYFSVGDLAVSDDLWGFVYVEKVEFPENVMVNINGQIYGPYLDFVKLKIHNKNFAFHYVQDEKGFMNINGTVYGPYDNIKYDFYLLNDSWVFLYANNGNNPIEKDSEKYVNLSGKIYGPYNDNVQITQGGFIYFKNGKQYINVKGQEYGPYNNLLNNFISDDSWKFSYKNENQWYLNDNGIISGPLKDYPIITADSGIKNIITKSGEKYFSINGQKFGPYERIGLGYSIGDSWIFSYVRNNNFYVKINK